MNSTEILFFFQICISSKKVLLIHQKINTKVWEYIWFDTYTYLTEHIDSYAVLQTPKYSDEKINH